MQGKLRELSLKLAKLEARVLLAERKASEGRKVTARIAASLVEEVRVEAHFDVLPNALCCHCHSRI